MSRRKRTYVRQKPILYFDENIPQQVVDAAQSRWGGPLRKHFKLCSVFDFDNQRKDDGFQSSFCRSKGFVLVTLDKDFMDDRMYPIRGLPGIIVVAAPKNDPVKILTSLTMLAEFISYVPFPKSFLWDAKFQVSLEGCIIRGRDAKRDIKTVTVRPGDPVKQILRDFGWL